MLFKRDNLESNSTEKRSAYLLPILFLSSVLAMVLGVNIRALLMTTQLFEDHSARIRQASENRVLAENARNNFRKQFEVLRHIVKFGGGNDGERFRIYRLHQDGVIHDLVVLKNLEQTTSDQLAAIELLLKDHLPRVRKQAEIVLAKSVGVGPRHVSDAMDPVRLGVPRIALTELILSYEQSGTEIINNSRSAIESDRLAAIYQCAASAVIGILLIVFYLRERVRVERALRKALTKSEAASKAKSQFLANMSHETRTPLNGMLGIAQLLEVEDLSDEARSHLETLQLSGENLLGILSDIIEYTDIESPGFELCRKVVDARLFFEGLVEPYEEAAKEKGLTFHTEIDVVVPDKISVDPYRYSRILAHLIDNACKFTDEGGVSIFVSVSTDIGAAEPHLKVDVVDTGAGIAPGAEDCLFDLFTQADESDTREYGGTGIGLSICKALALRMDGCLEFSSVQGEGSCFTLTVPFTIEGRERVRLSDEVCENRTSSVR